MCFHYQVKLILFKTVRRDGIEFITKYCENDGDSRLVMDKFVRRSIDYDSIAITILHFERFLLLLWMFPNKGALLTFIFN